MASTARAPPKEAAANGGEGPKNPRGLGPALPSRGGKASAGGAPGGGASGGAPAAAAAAPRPAGNGGAPPPAAAIADGGPAPGAGAGGSGSGSGSGPARPTLPARQARPAAAAANGPTANGAAAAANGPAANGAAAGPSRATPAAGPALPPRAAPAAAAAPAPRGGPSLPQRLPASGTLGVLDPEEPEATQKLRVQLHGIRVALIRVARRLGYDHDNGIVKQVLYRFYLAEKLKEPFRKGVRRPDPAALAAREATRLEEAEGPDSPLGLRIKILVIGLAGAGKTQLIRSLLEGPLADKAAPGGAIPAVDAFEGATKRVQAYSGCVCGVELTLIDTPGLLAAGPEHRQNAATVRAVAAAHRSHRPDLVVYVDRFDQPSRSGGELPVLQALTNALGPAVWLNTVVALTHAGAVPPAGRGGQMSYNSYAQQRNHLLQLIIRNASGDARLMNPMTFAESHPDCRRNARGFPIIPNGLLWQQHLLLLVASAKLLAEAEAAMTNGGSSGGGGGGGGRDAAVRQFQGAMGGAQLPSRYLLQALTQFSGPLTFPDHGSVMEVRQAKHGLGRIRRSRERRERARQIKMRLLQMSQLLRRQARIADMQTRATKAGAKMVPEQPRTANKTRPGAGPAPGWRYRVPEPGGGWVVRPHLEAHGMDDGDGVEGFMAEKSGVAARSAGDLLGGAPYRLSGSAQATKEQLLVSARADTTLYHDGPGLATTALSADVQTSGSAGTPDVLVVLRADTQRRGFPLRCNTPSAGLMAARLARRCRPGAGPLAVGVRLQNSLALGRGGGFGGAPVDMDVAVARMLTRPDAPGAGAYGPGGPLAAAPLDGGGPDSLSLADGWRSLWGANAELRTDARRVLRMRRVAPLSLSGSAVMEDGGEWVAAAAAGLRVVTGARSGVGAKVQVNNRGFCNASLQVRSHADTRLGLLGLLPLATLAWECVAAAAERRRAAARAGGGDGGGGGGGGGGGRRQQARGARRPAARQQRQRGQDEGEEEEEEEEEEEGEDQE
ncbi:hypothetical protein Rsub_06423 [Raphidocelis subcapitata]|uniref:AIG1-type G domain-containing protein n=1 Tax=Raphidocelis subcapitata TaxID=307507 RepID=A0A2V0P8H3_9CHLO|nr:hypothetical protein Rsub_06423 [Raphidocelis subcapitata]|eukprot:GBF93385.1 hypothetical protein Rsub_06423 [Raphidocelis subcapitata]